LSITGIGVLHSSSLAMGERYEIPLAREGAEPLSLLATVVRVERLDDDLYSIGLQFNSSAAVVDEGSRQLTGGRGPLHE
jgi:hypothetical protein